MGRKILTYALSALLFLGCALMVFLPLPHKLPKAGETYLCLWEDGTSTEEDYFTTYSALTGATQDGVGLLREEKRGVVLGSTAFSALQTALERGDLATMERTDPSKLSRLEQAALVRSYGGTAYYAGGAFRFTGEGIAEGELGSVDRVALIIGSLPANYLETAGASRVFVGSLAEFSAEDLMGSCVKEIAAEAPYAVMQQALVLETAGGRRLIAAPAECTELTLPRTDFVDRGALLPLRSLTSLTLPYAGEALRPTSSRATEFAWLFADGDGFSVPQSLKTIKITGGIVAAYCFYHCPQAETIDLCGIPAEDVSPQAFEGLENLKELHTSRADLRLSGFAAEIAPCGCTVYRRLA